MSPTQRSLKWLRDYGWLAEVVERFNPHSRTRHDLFGFGDIIAIHPDRLPLLVQTTSLSNLGARKAKALELESLKIIAVSFDMEFHGWRKLKVKRGGKAMRWVPHIERLEDFADAEYLPDRLLYRHLPRPYG